MTNKQFDNDNGNDGLLRARFTRWMEVTLARASRDYVEAHPESQMEVSIEELPEAALMDPHDYYSVFERPRNSFDFEEAKLAKAFAELPIMRREVLRLLFVEELSPREIAGMLHCSENYVHLQKSRALKKLRRALLEGGDLLDE